ncbi:MAG: hypothetical protein M1822_004528 [Bathelium mastoideum]|nr:MAG: hypothetical protein M1822_004528 [Bathelium mastoideum]
MTQPRRRPSKFIEIFDDVLPRSRQVQSVDAKVSRRRQGQYPPKSPPYSPVGRTFLPIKLAHRFGQLPVKGPFTAMSRVHWSQHSKTLDDSPPLSPKSQRPPPDLPDRATERQFGRSRTVAGGRPGDEYAIPPPPLAVPSRPLPPVPGAVPRSSAWKEAQRPPGPNHAHTAIGLRTIREGSPDRAKPNPESKRPRK